MAVEEVTHTDPVWRDRGDSVVVARVVLGDEERLQRREQLWARRLGEHRFELCCIPFFAYDLALGDHVETEPSEDGSPLLTRIVVSSDRQTFRAWFGRTSRAGAMDEVKDELQIRGCLTEWHSPDLVAIDAADGAQAQAVKELLEKYQQHDGVVFEASRTSPGSADIPHHHQPVWRDRADFLVHADIAQGGWSRPREQLWARRLREHRFELCCIPFFAYDLALGDHVETAGVGPEPYLITRVAEPSGHYTFRAWFQGSAEPAPRHALLAEIARLGCLTEWYSEDLLAIDATPDVVDELAGVLWRMEQAGHLKYETGRLSG